MDGIWGRHHNQNMLYRKIYFQCKEKTRKTGKESSVKTAEPVRKPPEQLKEEKARFWSVVSAFSSQWWGRHNGTSLWHLVTLSAVRKQK